MPSPAGSRRRFRRLKPEERRQELVEATLDCLSRLGPHGTGVREICRQVDVSPGLLSYYFDSKEDLILEALRALTRDIYDKMRSVLVDGEDSPEQRLRSAIGLYFSSGEIATERSGAYLAFWTLGRTDPAVRRIQRAAYRGRQGLLEPVLEELAYERGVRIDRRSAADGLAGLLDGLWLEICIGASTLSPAAAVSLSWSWLDTYVGGSPRRCRDRVGTSKK